MSLTLGQILPEVGAHLERLGAWPAGPPVTRYLEYTAERVEVDGLRAEPSHRCCQRTYRGMISYTDNQFV